MTRMQRSAEQLLDDALGIWHAGVDAVRPERLIPRFVEVRDHTLRIGDEQFDLSRIGRIAVVGAGKAGTGMVLALEKALGQTVLREKQVGGWVNVPADCLAPTAAIHLHAARPAGVNQPTAAGVNGTRRIIELVTSLGPSDLCLVLISGGGSALLPAPREGLTLQNKVAMTQLLSAAGATIVELNAVRRELSLVKGGGLARSCKAGRMVSLILSDVPGDDLETIASGPTVETPADPQRAIDILHELGLADHPAARDVILGLRQRLRLPLSKLSHPMPATDLSETNLPVTNLIVGNNATAVDAAGMEAERRGYSHAMISATQPEGTAEKVASHLVRMAKKMREATGPDSLGPDCLISGGEPTVKLVESSRRGKGGRNQQLALAALSQLDDWHGLLLLSGGTDGEDGPTDAAGAWVDEQLAECATRSGMDPIDYLHRNDAYHFFQPLGRLLKTGPTHTNVCDLRVVVVGKRKAEKTKPTTCRHKCNPPTTKKPPRSKHRIEAANTFAKIGRD